jgi:hypothetical protein
LRAALPDEGPLADALERGMAREPDARPDTASALVEEVEAALREHALPATEVLDAPGDGAAPAPAPQRTAEVEVEADAADAPGPADEEPPGAVAAEPEAVAAEPEAVAAELEGAADPEPDPRRPGARPHPGPATARPRRSRPRRPSRERSSPVVLLAAAAALAAAAIAAVIIAGGVADPSDRAATGGTATAGKGSRANAAAKASPATPAGAVKAFYGLAAAHRYEDAWALAAPGVRSQLGGFQGFRSQFATVRSIVFSRAATVRKTAAAAVVAIATTATHTNRVDHCTGTAETAPGPSGGWVVTHLAVAC